MPRRFARTLLTVASILVLAAVQDQPTGAHAQPRTDPTLFALPAADFPAGSQIVRAGVETDHRLSIDDHLHFGIRPGAVGRINGYYMDAVEGDPNAQPRSYTSYLVSIFHSARQADAAFSLRWYNWFADNYFTSPSPAPVTVGDGGEEAMFQSLHADQPRVLELFFRRGAVLLEVYQGSGAAAPTADELAAVYRIARGLDDVAHAHPAGT